MLSRAGASLPAAAARRRAAGLAAVRLRGGGPPLGRRWAAAAGAPRALEGLRVLELASVLAGPTVGQFLGELGADVVKAAGGVTAYFSCCNLGKRSVAVDARRPEGVELLHGLARESDVVLASYKPGDAKKLGLDAESLRALNPRLVYAELTGYGAEDARVGYDAVIQAEAGFTYINGETDGGPVKMPVALVDLLAAHQLKEGILVALLCRERTGQGGHVSTSLLAAAVASLANQATAFLKAGVVPQRLGSEHPSICPYGSVLEASDGLPLVLAVGSDAQFRQLCELLGCPELASDQRFSKNKDRVVNRAQLQPLLRARIAGAGPREALLRECSRRKIPAGAVNDMAAVFAQPGAEALVVRGGEGQFLGTSEVAWTGSGAAPRGGAARPPPLYGQHTSEVLRELLGLGDDRISALAADGVIHVSP